jgi:hypothetical protein
MIALLKEVIAKLESSFLMRWVLPFFLLLAGIVGLLILYPPPLLKHDLDLSSFAQGTRTKIAIGTISTLVAGTLFIAFSAVHSFLNSRTEAAQEEKREAAQKRIEAEFSNDIDNMGADEILLLSICLLRNTQVFNAPAMNPTCTKLAQRGCFATALPGFVNMAEFPYTINPVLWKVLKQRRQELLTETGLATASNPEVAALWERVADYG